MIEYTDECVGCPPERGCLGMSCPNKNVPHYFCDECGEEFNPEDLYDDNGTMVCAGCILGQYEKISVS